MKRLTLALSFLLFAQAGFCKNYTVHNQQEVEAIISQLTPGDNVIIANGNYTPWTVTLNVNGTAAKPITIKAQAKGKVVFSGDVSQPIFKFTGSYTILQGIDFTNCNVIKAEGHSGVLAELSNSTACRITECTFTNNNAKAQFMPLVIVSGKGDNNRVDHCVFSANVDNQELQVKVTRDVSPQHTLIDNNNFSNKQPVSWKNNNGGECVQIGQDPILLGTMQSYTMVRQNHFTKCNGEPEVISNKSSNNSYINNYFEDCDGELVMRGGHDCVIDSNTIKGGSSGIRVNGTGHKITNNKISNVKTGIRLMYGMAKGKTEIGFYVAASNCIIKNNTIENATTGIFIGDAKNADWTGKFDTIRYPSRVMQDVAPQNNLVSDNTFVNVQTKQVTQ